MSVYTVAIVFNGLIPHQLKRAPRGGHILKPLVRQFLQMLLFDMLIRRFGPLLDLFKAVINMRLCSVATRQLSAAL